MKAMTFTEVTGARADSLIDDDAYALEPKYDGVRTLVAVSEGNVWLRNRAGEPLAAASTNKHRTPLAEAFMQLGLKGDWLFDGELLDDGVLIVFDLPLAVSPAAEFCGPKTPYERRREVLEHLAEVCCWGQDGSLIRLATQALGSHKRALFEAITETGGEGVMLKRLAAKYEHSRTKTAGFKVKFTATVDCVVTATYIDGKENAELKVHQDGRLIPIGRCSLIGKGRVEVGDVVEVRYLYVGANGRLVQPRLVRVRGDKAATECTADQLAGTEIKKWVA